MPRTPAYLAVMAAAFASVLTVQAELKLPAIIGDHMVLQRDQENPIWGWTAAGTDVTVTVAGQSLASKADEQGKWTVKLPAMAASAEPTTITIKAGAEEKILSDILVGEVWVCSGQSNMGWTVNASFDADLEKATANFPAIRLISVPNVGTQELQNDFVGQWDTCTPETVGEFSGVGYFFGRQLHQTLNIPIGLIDNAWGGSAAEAWVSREVMDSDPRFTNVAEQWKNTEATYDHEKAMASWKEASEKAKAEGKPAPRAPQNLLTGNQRPGNLWAGCLNPIIGYGIRGAVWYQGESNAGRAYQYNDLFSLMISEWRKAWGQGDFSFYWVQLADFMAEVETPGDSAWAELREAQTKTLSLPKTGQAVIYDVGEGRDIHPRDKQTVGKRLARLALAQDYGMAIPCQSPRFASMEVSGNKATLSFTDVGSGLYTFDVQEAIGFAVAGEDKVWHNAVGKLVGTDKIEVTSDAVAAPVAVRYAWANNPIANLKSKEGLPVVPFRTDDWPLSTLPK
jgi:sialate O-acetylesterase